MNAVNKIYSLVIAGMTIFFLTISFQSYAKSSVLSDIREYKEWMSANYPHPEDLSTGELFYEGAKAVHFNQREPEVVALLEYIDQKFPSTSQSDESLKEYINWIKKGSNESFLLYTAPALRSIAAFAKEALGEKDINYIRCQYLYLKSEKYLRDVTSDFDKLISLQQKRVSDNNSLENQEQLCLLKFERALMEQYRDNPLIYDGIFSAEKTLNELNALYDYANSSGSETFEKVMLYKAAGEAFCTISQFDDACEIAQKYPDKQGYMTVIDRNRIQTKAKYYHKLALETVHSLLPNCHPAALVVLEEYNNELGRFLSADSSNLETAQYLYDFSTYYYPYDSLEQYVRLVNLWLMKYYLRTGIEDAFKIPIVKRDILKKAAPSDEAVINLYSQLLNLCAVYDKTSFSSMAEEFHQYINDHFNENHVLSAYLHFIVFVGLKDQDEQIYESYVLPAIKQYMDNSDPSVTSIILGRYISAILNFSISDNQRALEIQTKICGDIVAVFGEESVFRYNEELRRLVIQSNIDPRKTKEEYVDFIKEIKRLGYNPISWLNCYAQFLYYLCGDFDEAKRIYAQLIEACDSREGKMISPSLKAGYHFDYLNLLQDSHSEFELTEDIFNKAMALMESETDPTSMPLTNYIGAAGYLINTGRYNDALVFLDEGIRMNETLFNGRLDKIALQLFTKKVDLLSNRLNDIAQAQSLTNYLISKLNEERYTFYNTDTLSNLLLLYRARPYGSNTLLRINMLIQMGRISYNLLSQASDGKTFILSYMLPILSEWIRVWCEMDMGNMEGYIEDLRVKHPDIYNQNRETFQEMLQTQENLENMIFDSDFAPEEWLTLEEFGLQIKRNIRDFIYSVSLYCDFMKHEGEAAVYYMDQYAQSLKDFPYEYASAICDLGFVNFRYGNMEEADKYIRESLELIKDLQYLSSTDRVSFIRRIEPYFMENKDYTSILPLAREQYSIVKGMLDENIYLLSEDSQNDLLERFGTPIEGYSAIFHAFPEELASEMYDATLYVTGMQLRSQMTTREAVLGSQDSHTIALIESINILRNQIKEIHFDYENMADETYIKEMQKQQTLLKQLENELFSKAKENMGQAGGQVVWQDIRNALLTDEVAIEFVPSEDRLMAMILKQGVTNPLVVDVCSISELFGSIKSIEGSSDLKAKALYTDKVVDLYKFIWEPITPYLEGVAKIYYTMPGPLSVLSLGAVSDGDGQFLIDKYNLYQVTSTAELVRSCKMAPLTSETSALLLGGVFYTLDQKEEYVGPDVFKSILSGDSDSRAIKERRGLETDVFNYLPFTEFEISEIESSISKLIDIKNLTNVGGFEASETNVRALLSEKPSIIHLATHGFFIPTVDEAHQIPYYFSRFGINNLGSMYRAGLALCDAEKSWNQGAEDDKNDGILTAEEISQLDLRGVDLAVLSACESSLGNYSEEGVFGLPRGFKQAGVKSLIVSLWNVNDMSTALLMSEFYKNLAKGQSYMTAWKNSIKSVREKFTEPQYWGAFTMLYCME